MAPHRQIRISCRNTDENIKCLEQMGYRVSRLYSRHGKYFHLNIWTLEATNTFNQQGLLITEDQLASIAVLPTIDSIEQFIYTLQDDALKELGKRDYIS